MYIYKKSLSGNRRGATSVQAYNNKAIHWLIAIIIIFTGPTIGFAAVWYCILLSPPPPPSSVSSSATISIDPHPVSVMETQQHTSARMAFNFHTLVERSVGMISPSSLSYDDPNANPEGGLSSSKCSRNRSSKSSNGSCPRRKGGR